MCIIYTMPLINIFVNHLNEHETKKKLYKKYIVLFIIYKKYLSRYLNQINVNQNKL